MRIGMMTDVYKPHINGITNFVALNKRVLENLGYEVYVFTFGDEDHTDDEPNVFRSSGLPLLDTGYYLNLNYGPEARKLIHTMDVVHVHHPFLSGSLVLRYCRPRGIPIIFTNHTRYDLYAHAYIPILPDIIGETALEAFLPTFCRACDLVIAPSNGMRKVMQRFGVTVPIDVVPNGVDLRPFQTVETPATREEFGFSPEDVIFIYSGRLGPEKNLTFLLRAFNGAVQAYDNIRLLLIGDGPERDNLEDRVQHMGIRDHVRFTGMVPYANLPRYLAVGDVFATASVTEVHPLSVIEAMASGLPVLGIQSPGVGDTIEDGKTGLLVSEEDLAAFTAKMIRLTTQEENRREMGQNARRAAQAYDINQTVQVMIDRYHRVVSRTNGRKWTFRAQVLNFFDHLKR